MKKKWLVAIVLGAMAGAGQLAHGLMLETEARGGEDVRLLAAGRDLKKGDTLEEAGLVARVVPSAYVDERMIRMEDLGRVTGLKTEVPLARGGLLTWTDFERRTDGEESDIAVLVESGRRAMAIPVNSSLCLSGMLRPGHRVDILATFAKEKGSRSGKVTATVLQNVPVLATGTRLSGGAEPGTARYGTVTLSVGVEEGELLAFAMSIGELSVVLRGHQDLEIVRDIPEKGMEDIWESERRNALQEQQSESRRIERLTQVGGK